MSVSLNSDLIHAANDLERLRLDDVELLDLSSKVAILAVLAEEKPAFAQGLWDAPVDVETRDGLSVFAKRWNLKLLSTRHPTATLVDGIPEYVTREMDALRTRSDVLWLFRLEEARTEIEQACQVETDVGLVLGYPMCCVEEHRKQAIGQHRRFYQQLTKQYRPRGEADTVRLIREDPPVDVPGYLESLDRSVGRSFERFPFVSHTACRACLDAESSPTRELNERYRSVAEQAGAYFYKRILAARPATSLGELHKRRK